MQRAKERNRDSKREGSNKLNNRNLLAGLNSRNENSVRAREKESERDRKKADVDVPIISSSLFLARAFFLLSNAFPRNSRQENQRFRPSVHAPATTFRRFSPANISVFLSRACALPFSRFISLFFPPSLSLSLFFFVKHGPRL